ncbi:hypothetical protein [Chryseobacterium sp. M5A1_1a]
MKIRYTLTILFFNLIIISCQSKSDKINFGILRENKNIFTNKLYPLKYRNYTDDMHSRIVLQRNQIQEKWQPLKDFNLDYMDVYFNKENIIGFKGYFENNSKNNTEELYRNICKEISNDANFWQIKLKNDDPYILVNEWESKEMILGLEYEKGSKHFVIITINKNELPNLFDKVFYSEFLNLTRLRSNNSEIHLKELKILPPNNDKSFYKEKFKELKEEYNRK